MKPEGRLALEAIDERTVDKELATATDIGVCFLRDHRRTDPEGSRKKQTGDSLYPDLSNHGATISHTRSLGCQCRRQRGRGSRMKLVQVARARPEGIGLDSKMLQHADEEIAERQVLLTIEGQVSPVTKPASGQQDR